MIKRFLMLFISILLLMPLSAVYADTITGNDFLWDKEREFIKSERRRFNVSGPNGYVIVKDEPGSEKDMVEYIKEIFPGVRNNEERIKQIIEFKNGEELFIEYLYIVDGEYWGCMQESHRYSYPGWIPMNHLSVVYIREDFEEENKNKFYSYTGNYDAVYEANRIVLWNGRVRIETSSLLTMRSLLLKG